MNQEIEEVCREAGIGASAGMETERRKPLKLMVRQDLEVLLTEEGRGAEEIMMPQSLFEHAVLYRREKRVLPEMRHVRILHLQAEEEKVSLFFLPGLARSLPALKLICVEGEGRYTLSVDRDARVSGYSFAVFSRKVEKVTQFYPQAQGGEFPLLILPETAPADVCRACRVQLMIPFLAHPEWYGMETQKMYVRYLSGHAAQFFAQAAEEGHRELLHQLLESDPSLFGLSPEARRHLSRYTGPEGLDDPAASPEETHQS